MPNVRNQKIYHEASKSGIWSVDFKQPHMQIARAYTPIPFLQPETKTVWRDRDQLKLRFLIRKEKEGEVSSYLHALDKKAKIELRGPNIEYRIPGNVQTVVFLAGGTGIAPALQVASSLFELREKMKPLHLHILWANRLGEDCVGGGNNASYKAEVLGTQRPVIRQSETLKKWYPGRITVEYFVDEEGKYIIDTSLVPLLGTGSTGGAPGWTQKVVLVAGPDGFVDHFAGPKE